MNITREELAAFADDQLSGTREREVAAMVASDADLARQVNAHRALKTRLADHFSPIASEPVPDRLAAMLKTESEVVDFASAKQRREASSPKAGKRHWGWYAGPALAASMALAVLWPNNENAPTGYADAELARVLENRLVAGQASDDDMRILLSFRDKTGQYCRAFSGVDMQGIACRDEAGWRLHKKAQGQGGQRTEFRQAASDNANILTAAQQMAAGPALNADQEKTARDNGWQK